MKANFQIILLVITVVGSLFPQDLIAANRYSESAANKVYIDMIGELREMSKNIVIYSEQATAANMESFRKMRKTRNDADYLLTKLQYSDFAVNHKARFETVVVNKNRTPC